MGFAPPPSKSQNFAKIVDFWAILAIFGDFGRFLQFFRRFCQKHVENNWKIVKKRQKIAKKHQQLAKILGDRGFKKIEI